MIYFLTNIRNIIAHREKYSNSVRNVEKQKSSIRLFIWQGYHLERILYIYHNKAIRIIVLSLSFILFLNAKTYTSAILLFYVSTFLRCKTFRYYEILQPFRAIEFGRSKLEVPSKGTSGLLTAQLGRDYLCLSASFSANFCCKDTYFCRYRQENGRQFTFFQQFYSVAFCPTKGSGADQKENRFSLFSLSDHTPKV